MDDEVRSSVTNPMHEVGPDKIQCPDCGEEFTPGHLCRAGIEREIAQTRAAFMIAIQTVGQIRNKTIFWRRGEETARLKEISTMAKKALADIEELLYKEDRHESDAVNSGKSGSVSPVTPDSV